MTVPLQARPVRGRIQARNLTSIRRHSNGRALFRVIINYTKFIHFTLR